MFDAGKNKERWVKPDYEAIRRRARRERARYVATLLRQWFKS